MRRKAAANNHNQGCAEATVQKHQAPKQLSPWFLAFLVLSGFFCLATLFSHELPRFFKIFNLRNENNFAALYSGMFLLIIALQSFDGWAFNRKSEPRAATAWLLLSLALLALSFDEIGSLHETVHPFMKQFISGGEWSAWWTLLPFGLILAGMAAYALFNLYRTPGQRRTVLLICIGFALLASVALQEYIEQNLDWTANRALRFFKARLRPTVEEGTELLGMLVLCWATLYGSRHIGGSSDRPRFPALDGVVIWRRPVLYLMLAGAPIIAYFTLAMPETRHDHGAPADWPAAGLFLLAALGASRPFFASGRSLTAMEWVLVLMAGLGCANTILPPDSPATLPILTIASLATISVWVVGPRHTRNDYMVAAILMSIGLAYAWLTPASDFLIYTLAQYVGLAMYWVNTSDATAAERPPGTLAASE